MEDDNKKKLINETVTGRRLTLRRGLRYAAIAAICGAAFSIAAGLTRPLINNAMDKLNAYTEGNTENSESAGSPNASGDENVADNSNNDNAGSNAGNGNTENTANPGSADTGASSDSDAEQTKQPDADDSEINNYSSNSPYPIIGDGDGEEYNSRLSMLRFNAIDKLADSLITLTVTAQTNTWFDSELESTETFSGIILSIDDKEILILAPYVEADGKSLKVTFANGSKADAYIKQCSAADGLSVIAVSAADGISQETLDALNAVHYGSISELKCGMAVIAAGSPLGVIDSCSFGIIGYISDNEPGIDCAQYVFYSDLSVNPSKGTFIIDYDGNLIGVASDVSNDVSNESGYSRIVGISSLERIINSMMNGTKKAYLGIIGMDVDFDMKYSSVPEGVYVSDVVNNSPAYNAGIRHGDVITAVADRSVTDIASMSRIISSQKPGVTINVKLMRGSVNSEYRELEVELTLGER